MLFLYGRLKATFARTGLTNQRGHATIMSLVLLTTVLILQTGMSQVDIFLFKNKLLTIDKKEYQRAIEHARTLLATPSLCATVFQGRSIQFSGGGTLAGVELPDQYNPTVEPTEKNLFTRVILEPGFSGARNRITNLDGDTAYLATLTFRERKYRQGQMSFKAVELPVYFVVDGGNNITNCFATQIKEVEGDGTIISLEDSICRTTSEVATVDLRYNPFLGVCDDGLTLDRVPL